MVSHSQMHNHDSESCICETKNLVTGKDCQPVMDWATRLRIAVGSAKGLAYLHEDCKKNVNLYPSSLILGCLYIHEKENMIIFICISGHPRIIHRDIKAANILLDLNFEAMVMKNVFNCHGPCTYGSFLVLC